MAKRKAREGSAGSVSLTSIKPAKGNPRLIKDEKFKKLCESIEKFPKMLELRPMVVDSEGYILGGNMRYKALKHLGYKEIPETWIKQADELTDEERQQFIIKDNVGFGEWDWDILANDWEADKLIEWGLDIPDFATEDEIEAEEDDYEEPESMQVDIVQGDLITFECEDGRVHRLLCGDSTCSDTVDKLMDGNSVDLLFTDPPYNVAFNGRSGKHDVIVNDALKEDDFNDFIKDVIQQIKLISPPVYYIWCNWKFYGVLQGELEYKSCIVWAKNVFGLGRGYRHQHEFCLFNGKIDEGINNESDLWQIAKDSNYMHPTQKPIALSIRALGNHKTAFNILDLFGGSGSTMVGVHNSKRQAYLMELDNKYCQVITDRMMQLDDTIKVKINGVPYSKTEKLPF